jgi:hypothetical protein
VSGLKVTGPTARSVPNGQAIKAIRNHLVNADLRQCCAP